MAGARTAATATWLYAAAFGVPAIPVGVYLWRHGSLPYFGDLFQMYAGPWSSAYSADTLLVLLLAILLTTVVAAWSAWLLWQRRRSGAVLNLALIPVEAVSWWGFALPVPWLFGVIRIVAIVWAWSGLSDRSSVA